MRLLEAIIDANHRAVAGDNSAGIHPADYADELPLIALTCIDPRLNPLFPNTLGIPEDQFIWLRNAGNIIFEPMSSMMRSLALASAVKGGKEIAIIGHTDCQVAKTGMMQLLDRLKALGVQRNLLPDDLNDFFGLFASERQNIIKACEIARHSPLIGPKIAVHGLLIDTATGKLEWVVNGYEAQQLHTAAGQPVNSGTLDAFKNFEGGMKFPEGKIGDLAQQAEKTISSQLQELKMKVEEQVGQAKPVIESAQSAAKQVADYAEKHWPKAAGTPPKMPLPPPIRPKIIKP